MICLQVVKFLLECNAKLNKKDHYGNTPLIQACLRGNLETATTLLEVKTFKRSLFRCCSPVTVMKAALCVCSE